MHIDYVFIRVTSLEIFSPWLRCYRAQIYGHKALHQADSLWENRQTTELKLNKTVGRNGFLVGKWTIFNFNTGSVIHEGKMYKFLLKSLYLKSLWTKNTQVWSHCKDHQLKSQYHFFPSIFVTSRDILHPEYANDTTCDTTLRSVFWRSFICFEVDKLLHIT